MDESATTAFNPAVDLHHYDVQLPCRSRNGSPYLNDLDALEGRRTDREIADIVVD